MIHEPTGKPIRYVKGIGDGEDFVEVPDEEIVKGYEHAKGHHVLIRPEELDELKLEAKHTIDMARIVDEGEIDPRFWEKPYYLVPDGDEADEGYTVIRDALKQTGNVAMGQLVMHGCGHLVGIKAHGKGLCFQFSATALKFVTPNLTLSDLVRSPGRRECLWRKS
jgi:DNA end-binding protein Ku